MKREFTLKLSQTVPLEYINTRKPMDEVSKFLIDTIKKTFHFDGEIEVIEAKEVESEQNVGLMEN